MVGLRPRTGLSPPYHDTIVTTLQFAALPCWDEPVSGWICLYDCLYLNCFCDFQINVCMFGKPFGCRWSGLSNRYWRVGR